MIYKKMPLLSLPGECIDNIFSFLNKQTLYKCLFVNRYWCRLSIPMIWADPFEFLLEGGKMASLASTLLNCLNEEEISSLIPCVINVNIQSPLFEYGKFIRKIFHSDLTDIIKVWLDVDCVDCRVQKLVNVICHMIMRQGSNLQELTFYMYEQLFHIDLPKFSIFTTSIPGIRNLRTLELGIELSNDTRIMRYNTIEFLCMIPKFCSGIVNCSLELVGPNCEFIKPFFDIFTLQPLERIRIIYDGDLTKKDVEQFLHALEFRSETLKELSLSNFDFQGIDLSFISKLEHLEYIKFQFCMGLASRHFQILFKRKLHLKGLRLVGIESNIMIPLIHSLCGEILLELSLRIINPEIAKTIKVCCPKINFLHIDISSSQPSNLSAIPIICELSSLRILHIETYESLSVDVGLLAQTLGDHLIFVENLSFNFRIDLYSFEYFINNCKANLKKLNIKANKFMGHHINVRKSYLMFVDKYQKVHNSLKVLGISEVYEDNGYGFDWTCGELEIINSLKDQGVNIVSSYKLKIESVQRFIVLKEF